MIAAVLTIAISETRHRRGGTPIVSKAARPNVARLPHSLKVFRRVRFVASRQAVPILMYHVVGFPPAHARFPGLYVSPAEFAAQIQALDRAGFRGVTLDELRRAWAGRGVLPQHAIVVTFDNGYRSQFTQALPVLQRVGWVADENLQLTGLPPSQGGLTTAQVRALVHAGWELNTQGYSHADLTALDPAALHFQIAQARVRIRRQYHVRADWFCYPSGRYDATVIAAVKAAGFVGSTTVIPGLAAPADDPFRLPRLRVLRGTSPRLLLQLIRNSSSAPQAPPSYLAAR